MKVFKFGGASVKDAEAVKNVFRIVTEYKADDLCIIFSAMGKTTNALEKVTTAWLKSDSALEGNIADVEDFHKQIARDLAVEYKSVGKWINHLREITSNIPPANYDEGYDLVVSIGELLSTEIISAFLNNCGYSHSLLDARKMIKTDSTYRNAAVDWEETQRLVNLETSVTSSVGRNVYVTQGFIGSTKEGNPVTLGREGSDFSAAIFAWALKADEMIIWKDVPGVLNADPRYFNDTVKIDRMTYRDAIELAYYGASVIHPKTIQPLQSSGIPLYVKSFYNPTEPGTLISSLEDEATDHIPSFIFKRDQVLISVSPRDFSFIAENNLQSIFGLLHSSGIHFNMMQHSAISFSIVVDDQSEKMQRLFDALGRDYRVRYNRGLELITIRYYDQPTIDKVIAGRKVLLEQKSRTTVQLVVQ